MICALRKIDLSKREMFIFNDKNISRTVEEFLSITDEEISGLIHEYIETYEKPSA